MNKPKEAPLCSIILPIVGKKPFPPCPRLKRGIEQVFEVTLRHFYRRIAIVPNIAPIQAPTEVPIMAPILNLSQHCPILEALDENSLLNELSRGPSTLYRSRAHAPIKSKTRVIPTSKGNLPK